MARHQFRLTDTVAVAIGGALGALARVSATGGLGQAAGVAPPPEVLLLTLVINCGGTLALAFLLGTRRQKPARWFVLGSSVGFLGAFTTFSFPLSASWALGESSHFLLGFAYLAATLILGISAGWLGWRAARGEDTD